MPEKEISLRDLLIKIQMAVQFLFSKWKIVLIGAIIGLAGGLSYALFKAPTYLASVSFVIDIDQNGSSAMSSYTGLAARFGLDLGSTSTSNSLFTGDNIYDLMKTRRMLTSTLLTPVAVNGKSTMLINLYIQMERLREKWKNKPQLRDIRFESDSASLSLNQNRVIYYICNAIVKNNLQFPSTSSTSNQSSLMSVDLISKNEQFSALFLTNLIDNVERYYVATMTQKARTTLNEYSRQLDSVRVQLYGEMSDVASFQDRNLNLIREAPRVKQQKSSLRMSVNSAIYQQLVTGVETARMNLQKETPLFEVVDKPVFPLEKHKPGKLLFALVGVILGTLVVSGWLLCRRFYVNLMKEQ